MLKQKSLSLKNLGVLLLIFLSCCCFSVRSQELKTGDLIFCGEGVGTFSQAIAESTAVSDSMKFVHVGIIEKRADGEIFVIEASPEKGVREIALEEFKKNVPVLVVKRLPFAFPAEEAIERAKSHFGEGYDWWYLPDNGKMYCSELVYDSYYDFSGQRIFKSKPMNFRAPDGSMPEFWVNLFEQLGEAVPEGVEGTNPNDMSKDAGLVEVMIMR